MTNFRSARSVTFLLSFLSGLMLLPIFGQHLQAQTARPPISVDVERFPGAVRIKVAVRANLKSDFRFNAVVHGRDWSRKQIVITKELVIPAGQKSIETEISLIESPNAGMTAQLLILETNNNEVPDNQDYLIASIVSNLNSWQHVDSHLFVTSKINSPHSTSYACSGKRPKRSGPLTSIGFSSVDQLPNFSTLAPYYQNLNGQASSVTTNLSFLQNYSTRFYSIHPTRFFHDWQSLISSKGMFISEQDLKSLAQDKESAKALSHWLAVGGQLTVFDCDKNYSNREQILNLVAPVKADISRDREWFAPASEIEKLDHFVSSPFGYAQSYGLGSSDLPDKRLKPTENFDDKPFLITSFLNGHIVLIDDDMTDWQTKDWQVLFNATHGLEHVDQVLGTSVVNREFKQSFRLPGIGEPPVVAFQFLIWFFVILIGPVCYFLFYRTRRLHLLLASTPLISFTAVSALLLYAFLSDGFNLRGRSQSVTTIDHQAGLGVTHERQVYYSGVTPSRCQFDPATLVVDARSRQSQPTYYRYRGNDRLEISGGQVKARSHYQLTGLSCREIEQSVTFSKTTPDKQQITVSNSFGTVLQCVAYNSPDGWYLAHDVGSQSTAIATKVSTEEAASAMAKFLGPLEPSPRSRVQTFDSSIGWLNPWGKSNSVLANLTNNSLGDFSENTYIAIVKESEFASKPQADAQLEGTQRHVIIGKR